MSELKAIDLAQNSVATLPAKIEHITALEEIYLQNNKLRTLPDEFFRLSTLKQIYLQANQLDIDTQNRLKLVFKKDDVRF